MCGKPSWAKYDKRQFKITVAAVTVVVAVFAAFSVGGALILNKAFGSLYKRT